jgi:hypothetical protein
MIVNHSPGIRDDQCDFAAAGPVRWTARASWSQVRQQMEECRQRVMDPLHGTVGPKIYRMDQQLERGVAILTERERSALIVHAALL